MSNTLRPYCIILFLHSSAGFISRDACGLLCGNCCQRRWKGGQWFLLAENQQQLRRDGFENFPGKILELTIVSFLGYNEKKKKKIKEHFAVLTIKLVRCRSSTTIYYPCNNFLFSEVQLFKMAKTTTFTNGNTIFVDTIVRIFTVMFCQT